MGEGIPVKLEIYGSGLMKNELQEYIATKNLDPFVRLMGNLKLEELKEAYKASHFLILASQSEGWPKAVAEAMFFGCIPIATSVSCIPWMLNYGKRGILIPPPDSYRDRKGEQKAELWMKEIVNKIIELIEDPEEMKRKSLAAQEWSQEFTLERFEEGIKGVLKFSV
jgi:glycosyltransferase involved in cell wall biosynthesis